MWIDVILSHLCRSCGQPFTPPASPRSRPARGASTGAASGVNWRQAHPGNRRPLPLRHPNHSRREGNSVPEHGRCGHRALGPQRLHAMNEQGVDLQALSINGYWWYAADRDLARGIVLAQNEGLAKWVVLHPDRFVAMASVALQYPDLAAQQLEDAAKRLGLRGVSSADTSTVRISGLQSTTHSGPRQRSLTCWC